MPEIFYKRKTIFMSSLHLVFLSLLQGVTEFLPVSSSGHLILFSKFTNFPDQGLDMDIALHIGSVFAVMLYFSPTIFEMICSLWKTKFMPDFRVYGVRLFYLLVIATIPILLCGAALKLYGMEWLRNTKLIGWNILLYGIFLWFIDNMSITARKIKNLEIADAVLIGLAQCLALLPGTSRSGITITMCRFLGMERREAAKFSMLLSIPTILGAGILAGYMLWRDGSLFDTTLFCSAVGYSFVFSMLAIGLLMFWLKNKSFLPFVLYRVVLGVVLLLDAYGIYDIRSLFMH